MEPTQEDQISTLRKSNFRWKIISGMFVLTTVIALAYGQVQRGIAIEQEMIANKQAIIAQKNALEAMKQQKLAEASVVEAMRQQQLAEQSRKGIKK